MHISSRDTPAVRRDTSSSNVKSSINFGPGGDVMFVTVSIAVPLSEKKTHLHRTRGLGVSAMDACLFYYVKNITKIQETDITPVSDKCHNTFMQTCLDDCFVCHNGVQTTNFVTTLFHENRVVIMQQNQLGVIV
jgi:hypothetical protein